MFAYLILEDIYVYVLVLFHGTHAIVCVYICVLVNSLLLVFVNNFVVDSLIVLLYVAFANGYAAFVNFVDSHKFCV